MYVLNIIPSCLFTCISIIDGGHQCILFYSFEPPNRKHWALLYTTEHFCKLLDIIVCVWDYELLGLIFMNWLQAGYELTKNCGCKLTLWLRTDFHRLQINLITNWHDYELTGQITSNKRAYLAVLDGNTHWSSCKLCCFWHICVPFFLFTGRSPQIHFLP